MPEIQSKGGDSLSPVKTGIRRFFEHTKVSHTRQRQSDGRWNGSFVQGLDLKRCRLDRQLQKTCPWSFLGILIIYALELLQIGRPAQQCAGRSLVKVGGTYVAQAIRQYRTKPLTLGEGIETG
jgi:hypothetical protein